MNGCEGDRKGPLAGFLNMGDDANRYAVALVAE